MRFNIARLIDTNFDENTKFMTLTFKENIQDIAATNDEFKKFIKRLNYHVFKTKKSQIKYLATWEKQKRGAIHYHIILFSFPFVPYERLVAIWGHGHHVWINKIDVDAAENRGTYISKYFDKDLDIKEHKKKAFFKSQNLKLLRETKRLTEDKINKEEFDGYTEFIENSVLYISLLANFETTNKSHAEKVEIDLSEHSDAELNSLKNIVIVDGEFGAPDKTFADFEQNEIWRVD